MSANQSIGIDKRKGFVRTFSALRQRDFALFWTAMTISLLGVSFQTVAQGWLVYRLTGSAALLGLASFIPVLLAAPASIVGGMLADRVSRRKLVMITQSLMIGPPIATGVLVWLDVIQVWHVILSTTVLGVVAAIDLPSRSAMIPDLVPQQELLNAQGLVSASGQLAKIIGPSIAGLMIALWGETIPYLLNGVSYAAMVIGLLAMRHQQTSKAVRKGDVPEGIIGGVVYTLKNPLVFGLLTIAAAQSILLNAYVILLPVYANDILKVGATGLGILTTAVGVGALIGALGVAGMKEGSRGKRLTIIQFIIPVVLILFAWSTGFATSLPLLIFLGLGTVWIRTLTATYILTVVPDEVRGRVISFATLIYFGGPYLGGLPTGFIAEKWNAPVALTISGLLFFAIILLINWKIPAISKQV